MIVRIATEGQYELTANEAAELNKLDNAAVAACEAGDEAGFHETYDRLVAFVRSNGSALAADELVGSDVILPPPDVTFDEAREDFTGEGLLPA
ncbi:MAG: PspA-associated protein PspAA [Solirubrobacteraceae bacterium]